MVTFVCHHCDQTLKKKQLDKHVFQCRRPAKFICIDCQNTFVGDEYKQHTQCMTEQEKYHGPYAKQNKNKQNQQQQQQQKQQQQKQAEAQKDTKVTAAEEQKEEQAQKKQDKAEKTQAVQENEQEEEEQTKSNWKGWKKTIRKVIKQKANKQIKLRKLKELVCKKYQECHPEEQMMEIEKVFDEKLAANTKFQVINEPYVKL
ncbi:LYAR-type C2HC zinc finger protein (macronuclear) [Tetrahymena thermophila SB210]|uniref:LYAR-type C2HC zinc finger protein n=1 Tax=Tetrahymena thermophila (strain SB210) TaxID=312017 RepID=Q235N0_TETTS|nr:LYAR-type C2HC zinc finger protein [Tetrahymena thermophila SB210]EAR92250.1 LYAR-type C2HC zinc finger protein [Tetrahymena thermophila SB210]|eukprot:XP_001012495.1 LYAR-type C2HC zinc finger protein [Tetrahymena thermophila SB210]